MKAGVDAFIRLILDGSNNFGMAMTDIVDPDAAGKINEFATLHIDH